MRFISVFASTFAIVIAGISNAQTVASDITGDAAKGEKVFKKCKACHDLGPDAKNKVGPVLTGIVDRAAGTNAEYKYSSAMADATKDGALVWTPENLDRFLTKPKDFLAGTKMTFAGLRKEDQRADVIAYLATFKSEGSN